MRQWKSFTPKDAELARLVQSMKEFFGQFTNNPLLSGVIIKGVAVSTTAVAVSHNLGRIPEGYYIVKANAAVTVFDTTSTTPNSTIILTGSSTATVDLYIF